jgi:hypothetical protein
VSLLGPTLSGDKYQLMIRLSNIFLGAVNLNLGTWTLASVIYEEMARKVRVLFCSLNRRLAIILLTREYIILGPKRREARAGGDIIENVNKQGMIWSPWEDQLASHELWASIIKDLTLFHITGEWECNHCIILDYRRLRGLIVYFKFDLLPLIIS